jgi:hypothetical protein
MTHVLRGTAALSDAQALPAALIAALLIGAGIVAGLIANAA